MLISALVFFALAFLAAVFGFRGMTETSGGLAEILFYGFLALGIIALVTSFTDRHSNSDRHVP